MKKPPESCMNKHKVTEPRKNFLEEKITTYEIQGLCRPPRQANFIYMSDFIHTVTHCALHSYKTTFEGKIIEAISKQNPVRVPNHHIASVLGQLAFPMLFRFVKCYNNDFGDRFQKLRFVHSTLHKLFTSELNQRFKG